MQPSPRCRSTSASCSRRPWTACGATRSEERRVGKECRSRCDWSSDVCSSDLDNLTGSLEALDAAVAQVSEHERELLAPAVDRVWRDEIGRASCRERV